jgi:2-polyprenyl-3-methyl-5-hydroxy-6-metoxy-1,4-benzoquinol methylase
LIQSSENLNNWYSNADPWGYEQSSDDLKRKSILLAEIPRGYERGKTLDIGCGHGFITRDLPGESVLGIDLSENAIGQAKGRNSRSHVSYQTGDLLDLAPLLDSGSRFDLIIVTGVLYPQYIGKSFQTVRKNIDRLLNSSGCLISVHIEAWCPHRFPYLSRQRICYQYREYDHQLEVYLK